MILKFEIVCRYNYMDGVQRLKLSYVIQYPGQKKQTLKY